jgi:hypothetical protein
MGAVHLITRVAVTGSVWSWGRKGGPRTDRCEEVRARMPRKEPKWLQVVIRIVLDWRFLLALAVLVRVLLNR